MQAVLQIELATPRDDVCEQVAVERGVLVEQRGEIELDLRGHEVVEPDLLRRERRPVPVGQPVFRVRATVADSLEDHPWQCRQPPNQSPTSGRAMRDLSYSSGSVVTARYAGSSLVIRRATRSSPSSPGSVSIRASIRRAAFMPSTPPSRCRSRWRTSARGITLAPTGCQAFDSASRVSCRARLLRVRRSRAWVA